jgi:hypothetical protein
LYILIIFKSFIFSVGDAQMMWFFLKAASVKGFFLNSFKLSFYINVHNGVASRSIVMPVGFRISLLYE